jgi:hypothetical protein
MDLAAVASTWPDGYTIRVAPIRHRPRVRWIIGPVTDRTTPSNIQRARSHRKRVDMILQDHQQVTLTATFVDAAGNSAEAPAQGTLAWVSSDPAVLVVTDNGDGSALVATTGTLGTASVTLSDDLDGDGVSEFVGSLAFDVVTGPVTGINLVAGDPTERP